MFRIKSDKLLDLLSDEMLLEEVSSKYIEHKENSRKFVSCFILGFEKENKDTTFDFVEVFDCEEAEIEDIYYENDKFKVNFSFGYILSVWYEKNQLSRITAEAKGTCSFVIVDENQLTIQVDEDFNLEENNYAIDCLQVEELSNVLDEYDDLTVLI